MLQTPPQTDAAFIALLEALDAEIRELQAWGQERFHAEGLPRAARPLLRDAVQHGRIRGEVAKLHAQWSHQTPMPPPPAQPLPAGPSPEDRKRQADFKALPGMTHREAAKRLGVSAPKVLGFLESGKLKGSQLSRTKWKISGPDLVTFARNHSDLLK